MYISILLPRTTNNTINNTVPTDDDIENNTTTENITNEILYDFNNADPIEINNLTFSNIKFDAGKLSYLINNNGESDLNLTDNGYFIKLYDEKSPINLFTLFLNNGTIYLGGY